MSDNKYAYGWYGHILVSEEDRVSVSADNLVAIPERTLMAIYNDYECAKLPRKVRIARLGIIDSPYILLATGVHMHEGFDFFGSRFPKAPHKKTLDAYMRHMKRAYGLDLPPPVAMFGCSSEH